MKEIANRSKGGIARSESLSPERRKEIAMKGVDAKKEKAGLVKASYEGKLRIGDAELDVAVLENKQRIVTLTAVFRALDRPIRGNARLINMPTFMDAKNLQPFIGADLSDVINKVKYINLNGKVQEGYDALIIPLVSDLYLKARAENKLSASQEDTAKKAEILVRTLAKVGIVALVDEATGYQRDRAKDELSKILEAFVAKELQPWIKTFPADFYENMFRLRDLEYPGNGVKRPQYFGHLTNDVIYRRLAPMVLQELKEQAKKDEKGKLKHKLHQKLTPDIGHPKLKELVISVTTVMKLSDHWSDFKGKLDRVHPAYNETMPLPFEL
jgi:hypothetical protein